MSVSEIVDYDEYRRGDFFHQWAKPQGWVDAAKVVIERSATSFTELFVCRNEKGGVFDDDTRSRTALIVPHIRRAMLIGKAMDLKRTEAKTLAETFDGLSAGLFLVDARGQIVHANAAGRDILAMGHLLHSAQGRLVTNDPQANQSLREIFTHAGRGDEALGLRGIALPIAACDGERYVFHVLPLTSGERRLAGMTYTAAAAVFVCKAGLQIPTLSKLIGATYNLTPAELRVLLAVVEVGGVPDVAVALGVADTTIRTHLGRVFEKTGVGRQADLVKLVAGFSTPLVG